MNFNLIPHDIDSYKIYADFQEDNGVLLTNAIRNKILPLDVENGNGQGYAVSKSYILGYLSNFGFGSGDGYGYGYGYGSGFGEGEGEGEGDNNQGWGIGYGDGDARDGCSYGWGDGYGNGRMSNEL